MYVANDKDGNRVYAEVAVKGVEYYCPICGNPVILRHGEINTPHFAHHKGDCIDTWSHDMSDWHRRMQELFPPEMREIIVTYNGETHRADILFNNLVIEFQHSPISSEEIRRRTEFYCSAGYRIAWVFDLSTQYDTQRIVQVRTRKSPRMFRWVHPMRCLRALPKPSKRDNGIRLFFYHCLDEGRGEFTDVFRRVTWASHDEDTTNFKFFITDKPLYGKHRIQDFFV